MIGLGGTNDLEDFAALRTYRYVYVKQSLEAADPWIYASDVDAVNVSDTVAPGVNEANFEYMFGSIVREQRPTFQNFEPVEGRNLYVKIETVDEGAEADEPVVRFTGFIPEEQFILHRPDVVTGDQLLKAYGIEYIFERNFFEKAYVIEDTGFFAKEIGWAPTFNDRGQWGATITGNRSDSFVLDDNGDPIDGVYAFGNANEEWTALDVMNHLLWNNPWKEFLDVQLTGQSYLLATIWGVWDLTGKSYWECFNELINFRYGLGFWVRTIDNGGDISLELEVYLIASQSLGFGGLVVVGNPNTISFTMPPTYPNNHLVGTVPYRTTSLNRYDVIDVVGGKVKVCAPFCVSNGSFENGWSAALEAEYNNPDVEDIEDEALNDEARKKDRYNGVYTRFRVPKAWDWLVGNLDTASVSVAPKVSDVGLVTFDGTGEEINSTFQKEFFRDLPFQKGKRYDTFPITDENEPDTQPEFVPSFVLWFDVRDTETHDKTDRWHLLDNCESVEHEDLKNIGFRVLDKQLGIELTAKPNHLVAYENFMDPIDHPGSENAQASGTSPALAYEDLMYVGFFETDQRLKLSCPTTIAGALFGINPQEMPKKLTIDVPECEYWYSPTCTPCGISDDGNLQFVAEGNQVIRDDRLKMLAILVFALAWYSKDRQATQINIKQVGKFVELGTVIDSIDFIPADGVLSQPVNTVVTSRNIDFKAGTTTITTGYQNLDVKTFVGSRLMSKRFSGRKGAATKGVSKG